VENVKREEGANIREHGKIGKLQIKLEDPKNKGEKRNRVFTRLLNRGHVVALTRKPKTKKCRGKGEREI